METLRDKLLQIVAKLGGVALSSIKDETKLSSLGLHGSARLTALQGAIKRAAGKSYRHSEKTTTFGQLFSAVDLSSSEQTTATEVSDKLPSLKDALAYKAKGLACGIDVEEVSNMPLAEDFWEESFYKDNFTAEEIAYCISQEQPRLHFAARWCAKEALKKCDTKFMELDFSEIEVRKLASGAVKLRIAQGLRSNDKEWSDLPHLVSISHTDTTAAAVVLSGPVNPFSVNEI